MSQKVYADEATLTAHLDKLLSTATPTHTPSLYTDTTITINQLLTGHALSNEQLSKIGITQLPPLPPPNLTKPVDEVLAAAFTAIIRLSQCAQANKNLRESAEASLRNSTRRVEELTNRLSATEEKLKKKDAQITNMHNTFDETVSKHRVQLRKLSAESNQLRSRLLHASHRENQLILSSKKKEKEFGQLQSRVHALFKTSVSIDQRITRVGTRISPRSDESLHADLQNVGQDRVHVVEEENDAMRGLLQAVQEELDDLILSHGDTASDVSQEFDVPPAPGDDVMGLPLEVIQNDLQDCLEKKFNILRRALERGGRFDEYESEDIGGGEEIVDVETGGHGGDTVSADSAHRSVDVMSGNVERVDGVAHSVDANAENADADDDELVNSDVTNAEQLEEKDEQVDTEAAPIEAGSEPIEMDAEQVDADAVDAEHIDADAEQLDVDAARVGANFVPVDADGQPVTVDSQLIEADTAPLDKAAITETGSADEGIETVGKSADAVDGVHESLEDTLKTLSITETDEDVTKPINPNTNIH